MWPIQEQYIDSLSSSYSKNDIYALITTREEDEIIPVFASSSGVVLASREVWKINMLPGIVVMKSVNDVLVTYQNVLPDVVLGQHVEVGDYIGSLSGGDELVLKMYDTILETAIDPFFILPNVERALSITLLGVQFQYVAPVEQIELSRRIRSGLTDAFISIKITDNESKGHILPYVVWLDVDGVLYSKTTDEILSNNSITPLESGGIVHVLFNNIQLPNGYFNLKIGTKTLLRGNRVFRFSVFAY